MTYRTFKIISGIRGIRIFEKYLILGHTNMEISVNNQTIATNVDTSTFSLVVFDACLFFDIEDKKFSFDFSSNTLNEWLDIRPYFFFVQDKKVLCTKNARIENGNFVWDTVLFDYSKSEVISNYAKLSNVSVAFAKDTNLVICYLKTCGLTKFSLRTGNYEWELDLGGYKYLRHGREEEGKIDKIIGLWEHQLLVAMSDEELVSVDIHTGKVLWKTSNFNNTYLPDWRNRSMFRMSYWLIEAGKLYQLDGNVYYSVDLETQQFDLLWHNANDENELTIVHKTYTEDYIYFTGAYHYQLSPNLVGVFNRKTLTIDWITAVENLTGSLNQPPQVADDKLYVLDTGGTLHIFAREEKET